MGNFALTFENLKPVEFRAGFRFFRVGFLGGPVKQNQKLEKNIY